MLLNFIATNEEEALWVSFSDGNGTGAGVGYRVPAKPLRFELWGAREDLPPTDPRPNASS